jgi:HTH-type transcriptional regulator/antitoxin HigA
MVSRKESKYRPAIAIPPGASIRDNMKALGMDQEELSERLGITTKHLSHLLNGKVALTNDMALRLEDVFGADAEFWLQLEINYQIDKAHLNGICFHLGEEEILKQIPYRKMMDYGWIEKRDARSVESKKQIVASLRRFFAVASLNNIQESYMVSFRKQKLRDDASDYGTLAWLRQAEILGAREDVYSFDRDGLKDSIAYLRAQTVEDANVFYPRIKDVCAKCGIALVLVEHLPKTGICGATIWKNESPILALSLRGRSDDQFWFTFFHEIVHLLDQKRRTSIQFEKTVSEEERAADKTASDILIPAKAYRQFIDTCNYRSKNDIERYSRHIGIAPSILLGRLQHDGYLDYSQFNDLKKSFAIR